MNQPYAFCGPYSGCLVNPDVAMDPRHVYVIHAILRAWPFASALELGSFWGASSTAFIEAINRGSALNVTLCEVMPPPALFTVAGNCRHQGRVRMTRLHSWDALAEPADHDFILVDANHDLASVQREMTHLLRRRPLCVMAHDTHATAAGYAACEGAQWLADTFRSQPDYRCREDCASRAGERTERGLFFATTEPQLDAIAEKVFESYK